MSNLSIFDIAGPVMVGPSSSHTAGACKIGQFARALFHDTPTKVTFYLHGSFGEVYKGHATDRALLGGVMKFRTSDPRIRDSFDVAEKEGLEYHFIVQDLGKDAHPNTVKIVLEDGKNKMAVTGCSVGGGMVEIVQIDDFKVSINGSAGKYQSLVVCHKKTPEVLKEISEQLKEMELEIAEIAKSTYGDYTLSVLSLDGKKRINLPEVLRLEKVSGVEFVRSLSKLDKS